jgi:PhnB protein
MGRGQPSRLATRATRAALAAAALAAVAWAATGLLDGPWGMIPGGRLRGLALPCEQARWTELSGVREIELEVRPRQPRSVTTWMVVHDGSAFVPADFLTPWKRWPWQVLEDGRVRLRAAGRLYACAARRVGDPDLIAALRRAAARKYGLDPAGAAARTEVWWFRIGPRAAPESRRSGAAVPRRGVRLECARTARAAGGDPMPANPPENMPRITPYLYYEDVARALAWLGQAFGFRERMRLPGPDGSVSHAEMELGEGVIMLGHPGPTYRSPKRLGQTTQNVYVYVDDVDKHYERAREAGAVILAEPEDQFYGDRRYGVEDLQWYFAQHVRDVAPEDLAPSA